MVTITLYMRQQKRHWCIEQSFGLCGRGRRWDDLEEWRWNMYNIIYEMSRQSRFDAWYWMLGAGTLGRPRGMVWGGRREEGSGWGILVYLWQIHFDIWQNQYNIVKLNKIKLKKKKILPTMQETCVRFWGQEDPLEKEMAAHSGILIFLPGKFHGQRSLEGYSPRCRKTRTRLSNSPTTTTLFACPFTVSQVLPNVPEDRLESGPSLINFILT